MGWIHQAQEILCKKNFFKGFVMMSSHKFGDDCWRLFKFFHIVIIALFCLTLGACGNKADPSYPMRDNNGSVIEVKPYQKLDRW